MESRRMLALLCLLGVGLLLPAFASAQESDEALPPPGPADHPPAPRPANLEPVLYTGTYIRFVFDPFLCDVHEFSAHGIPLFENIEMTAPCTTLRSFRVGGSLQVQSQEETLLLYDTQNAFISFRSDSQGVLRFHTAAATDIVGEGSSREIQAGDMSARVFPLNTHYTLGWSDQGFTAIGARGNILVSTENLSNTPVAEALAERRIGGEVNFFVRDGQVENQVLAYEEVDMRASQPADDAYRVILDSDLSSGRTFVANFPTHMFDGKDLGVTYYTLDQDGVAALADIAAAANLADILDPADGSPEYWIVNDVEGTHVLVSVPQWSVHMFEVLGLPPQLVPIIVYGAVLGLLFTALAAVGMFTRSRQAD